MKTDYQPQVIKGVPFCTNEGCKQFDGKRCELIGWRPGTICEPAVKAMSKELKRLRKVLRTVVP